MKPIPESSTGDGNGAGKKKITLSIYTGVLLNHSPLHIIQREFESFFSRVERFNSRLTVSLGCMRDTSAHLMV
jgi:hypothetical protein